MDGRVLVRWLPCDHSRGIRFANAEEAREFCRDMNSGNDGVHHFVEAENEDLD